MDPLRVYLLGGFLLERDGNHLSPLASRGARSLLAYLIVHRDRPHSRNLLAGMYWPDLSEPHARRRLSQALWQVHDVLGGLPGGHSYLRTDTDYVAFNPAAALWVDVDEFEGVLQELGIARFDHPLGRLSDIETLRRCVDLYRGDFMAGFYEDWVSVEQQRLRHLYVRALNALVNMTKARGDYEEGLGYARQLTHHEPLREEGHRDVMRLLVLLGRPNEALAHYERCRSILQEELQAEPAAATIELQRRIVRHREAGLRPLEATQPSFPQRDVPLVGRARERSTLIEAMEQALAGRGGVALIEGEPGVGKSRLLREAAQDANWRGFEVLWGVCQEMTSSQPYQPLADALEASLSTLRLEQLAEQVDGVWLREAAQVVPKLSALVADRRRVPLRAAEGSQRMREALARVFEAMGHIGPTVVVLDDVQWAGDETLQALRQIADLLAGTRLVLCVAYRTEEVRHSTTVWETIRRLDQKAGVCRLVLSPLSVFETDELVNGALGRSVLSRSVVSHIHEETGGNPMFVLETLRALHERGLVPHDNPEGVALAADLTELPMPSTIHRTIAERLGLLDDAYQPVVQAIAVQGIHIDLPTIVAACAQPRELILQALQELTRRGLLIDDEGGYEFSHDQVRRVAYELVPARIRPNLHQRVGSALAAEQPAAVELIAHHFRLGEHWRGAFEYSGRAGARAATLHAHDAAVVHFRTAIDAAERAGVAGDELLKMLADLERSLAILAHRDEQAAVLDRMESLVVTEDWAAEVSTRRAWHLAHTDRMDEAVTQVEDALVRHGVTPSRHGPMLVVLATALSWLGKPAAALPHLERAAGLSYDDPQQEAEVRTALGATLAELQEYDLAMQQLHIAQERCEHAGDLRGRAEALGLLATIQTEQGSAAAAEATYVTALGICREIGYRHGEGVNLVNLANQMYAVGRIADALDLYRQATDIFRTIGNHRFEFKVQANAAAVRHLILGDDNRARQEATEALSFFESVDDRAGEAQCLEILAGISARRGRLEDALGKVRAGIGAAKKAQHRWLEVHLLRSLANLELETGNHASALRQLSRAERLAVDLGMDEVLPQLQAVRGQILLAGGDPVAAVAATDEAINAADRVEQGYLIFLRRYEALRAANRLDESRDMLEKAHHQLLRAVGGLTSEQRSRALSAVPEHRAIEEAWLATQPVITTIRLPAVEAPTGRPLRPDEWVEVNWTVSDPADGILADPVARRRRLLLRLMDEARNQGAAPTVDDLAAALRTSRTTVRRDLAHLREQGQHVFTRGSRSA